MAYSEFLLKTSYARGSGGNYGDFKGYAVNCFRDILP